MKLRDRTKRVMPNIKQEDRKSALTIAEATISITTDTTNTVELTIKQEDAKEDEALLKQHGEFSEKDYYYRCDICEIKMTDLKSVLEHRHSIHIDKRYTSNRKIKNIDTEPDIHDHNFYCKSCERRYNNKKIYRSHLKAVHYMVLKPLHNWKARDNNVFPDPDPDDPNLYCRACDHTYARKSSYNRHCQYLHGMKHVKVANQHSTMPSSLMDTYCQVCDRRFARPNSYRRHLFTIHKVDWRLTQQTQSNILPNANDPNFYCCSCSKKMANKESFKHHLMQVHSIFQSAPRKKSRLNPDVNNPNNHCRVCQRTYPSKGRYRLHLRMVHHVALPPLRGNHSRTDLPDPYNPIRYCSVCKKTYESLSAYRVHCKCVHFMSLNHASIVNPDAEININNPDLYCAQCERTYTTKYYFKQHFKVVHKI
ncbi:hypothetical protein MBANPS3_008230 [Mucor bainieri]